MIDHVGFAVSEYECSKGLYAQALAPPGLRPQDQPDR